MHDQYNRFRVSHPSSVELYKLSNHTPVTLIQENILVYVFVGVVGVCISIKCMQRFLHFCSKISEVRETSDNILTTDGVEVDSDDASESYGEESYQPPEELQTAVEATITKANKSNSIEPIVQENEDSENSEDLPSYFEVCVKPNK